jgi:hypothetical protein
VFIIRCIPDPFTQERINIGVCAIGVDGKRHVKTITEPGRLQCFYGDASSTVVSMAQIAAACAINGDPPPSEQILFDEPLPFYNADVQEMLISTFRDQVTVALPQRIDIKRAHMNDEDAINFVVDAIKQKDKNLLSGVLANPPHVIVHTDKGNRALHIPLQPINGVGSIRSADYSSQALKTHLMESVLDLECAARVGAKRRMGLFVLRPSQILGKQAIAADNVIDTIHWKKSNELFLEVSDSKEFLADSILDWAK